MNNEKTVSVLNDLLNITNDRIEGFKKWKIRYGIPTHH